jgi:nitrate/nitrite-specific signal transduction histidine kinase
LTAVEGKGRLVIKDDGKGIPEGAGNSQGMGLNIMRYRSGMIGGVLEIRRESTRGTTIVCTFPLRQGE